jgi:hypothetical protein
MLLYCWAHQETLELDLQEALIKFFEQGKGDIETHVTLASSGRELAASMGSRYSAELELEVISRNGRVITLMGKEREGSRVFIRHRSLM